MIISNDSDHLFPDEPAASPLHRGAMPDDAPLVPTGVAAKNLGVAHSTLARWWQEGRVTPTLVTPGGHARWDVEDLREQLRALRRPRADGDSNLGG